MLCPRSANPLLMLVKSFAEENINKTLLDEFDAGLKRLSVFAETARAKLDFVMGLNRERSTNYTLWIEICTLMPKFLFYSSTSRKNFRHFTVKGIN